MDFAKDRFYKRLILQKTDFTKDRFLESQIAKSDDRISMFRGTYQGANSVLRNDGKLCSVGEYRVCPLVSDTKHAAEIEVDFC